MEEVDFQDARIAAGYGDLSTVEAWLSQGGDVNSNLDIFGRSRTTLLAAALLGRQTQMREYLVAHQSEVRWPPQRPPYRSTAMIKVAPLHELTSKQRLWLTWCKRRLLRGKWADRGSSRFLEEIPDNDGARRWARDTPPTEEDEDQIANDFFARMRAELGMDSD